MGWENSQFVNEQPNPEGSPWWRSRRRVAHVLDGSGVVMDVAAVLAAGLNGGSPAIVMTTGLLAVGLHFAAKQARKKR